QPEPGKPRRFDYSRSGNPTRAALEACLAALEGGASAFAFASGCAAATTILHTLRPGDHVVCGDDVYGGTYRLFEKVLRPLGIEASFVDLRDPAHLEGSLSAGTRMVWLETPTNPLLTLLDIRAAADLARQQDAGGPHAARRRDGGGAAPAPRRRGGSAARPLSGSPEPSAARPLPAPDAERRRDDQRRARRRPRPRAPLLARAPHLHARR